MALLGDAVLSGVQLGGNSALEGGREGKLEGVSPGLGLQKP